MEKLFCKTSKVILALIAILCVACVVPKMNVVEAKTAAKSTTKATTKNTAKSVPDNLVIQKNCVPLHV